MPFLHKIETKAGTIGIWEFDEPAVELLKRANLNGAETEQFDGLRVERRRREFLATRMMLAHLLDKKEEISYTDQGKPLLKNGMHISISHSADYGVVFLSGHKIGIDVEQTGRNIDKIATRFLHPDEMDHIENLQDQQTAKILYWAAKEAIFKCSDHHGIQFNKQIFVHPFKIGSGGEFRGSLTLGNAIKEYLLGYFFLENNVVVYCVEQ